MAPETYQEFAKEQLGFEFKDITLLITALTHRSYVNEHRLNANHNERLEFLGDAVLELVTSDFLYRTFPDQPEGIMTAWRSALVRTESIGAAGVELGYEPLIRLSRGEKAGSERAHAVIIADCFEALIGAIYLDQGYNTVKEFINHHILNKMDQVLNDESWRDPKSYFQELAQKFESLTPSYRTLREEGPDHDKLFVIGAYVGHHLRGEGSGHSKQEAQTAAAKEAIQYYKALQAHFPHR